LFDRGARSATREGLPRAVIVGLQITLKGLRMLRQPPECLRQHNGISDSCERSGRVPNPPIVESILALAQTRAQQAQRRPDAFAGLARQVHGLLVRTLPQRFDRTVHQRHGGIVQ
jgi:hypothetical protein